MQVILGLQFWTSPDLDSVHVSSKHIELDEYRFSRLQSLLEDEGFVWDDLLEDMVETYLYFKDF